MSTSSEDWKNSFRQLFTPAVERYRQGHQKASGLVDKEGGAFLKSIGYTEQEFFDFVEDFAKGGEPSVETAIQIAAVRRRYFLEEQGGRLSDQQISMEDLPAKDAELGGIPWLPRIIVKAEAKLRGEMPPDLMYGCGGDRRFFRDNSVDPAEFLEQTWLTNGDSEKLLTWIKGH